MASVCAKHWMVMTSEGLHCCMCGEKVTASTAQEECEYAAALEAAPFKGGEADDPVSHPSHYTSHPSGIECIDISKFHSFCIGNAIKYIWRHKDKGRPAEDLRKAIWYLQKELEFYEAKEPCGAKIREPDGHKTCG